MFNNECMMSHIADDADKKDKCRCGVPFARRLHGLHTTQEESFKASKLLDA